MCPEEEEEDLEASVVAWVADGIDMNARGTLNGEEALESGYRIYYSAPEDTIDGVAAAIGGTRTSCTRGMCLFMTKESCRDLDC